MGLSTSNHKERAGVGEVEVEKEQRGWHELHHPLLDLILANLPLPDYIRFAAVCSFWRQVQRSRYVPAPRHHNPWLIYHNANEVTGTHTIFNHSGKSREIELQGTNHKYVIGSAHGWLIYACNVTQEHFLLNPITNCRIYLPVQRAWTSTGWLSPAILSSNPIITDPNNVIVMFMVDNALIFCRLSDNEWSIIQTGEPYTSRLRSDMVACNGNIYILTQDGKFGVVDVSGSSPTMNWLIHEDRGGWRCPWETFCQCRFLVESLGEVLLVLAYRDLSFKIYKADLSRMTWVAVPDLGDRVLFLGRACSLSASAAETGRSGIYITYPGDQQILAKDTAEFAPGCAKFVSTWKLALPESYWHWMLPSL